MIDPLPIGVIEDAMFEQSGVFAILPEARRKHIALFGATGAGKSALLSNMVAYDLTSSGVGVTVVCPASTTFSGQRQLFFPIDDNYKLYEGLILG